MVASSPRTGRGPGGGVVLLAVLLGALLGGAGGFVAGLYLYPERQPAPEPEVVVVAEPDDPGPPLASGRFRQPDPDDRMHWGSGEARLYARELRLGDDFEVSPGPKYHLYLVPIAGIDPDTRVEESLFVDLGPLVGFVGAQSHAVPAGLRLEDYPSVVVWCEQLNRLVSVARLVRASNSAAVPESSTVGEQGNAGVDERW